MSRLSDVKEVLRVAAPELIVLTVVKYTFTSCSLLGPFSCELLLEGVGQLNDLNVLRGKDTEEEWALLFLFVFDFCVGYYDVVHIPLVMNRRQPSGLCDFSLFESLTALSSCQNYVISVDLPETITLRFNSNHDKVYGNVWSLRDFLILLHQADDELGLLCDRYAELRVVKPTVICIKFYMAVFVFFISIRLNWVGTSRSVSSPL